MAQTNIHSNISSKHCRTFLSVVCEHFSKIYHISGHKVNLNKYWKIEVTPCILLNNDRIKLEMRLNNILLYVCIR